ncbi:MAG: hypothetical protein CMD16_04385 [Flavobacteriales bacterium]|nr:hypothetical protein [Flavobacteriales bacterium]|tara:strand:+ start:3256 stop:4716 length:1461 start_codon:yes stop_codon:yes gene_type:complete
MTRKTLTVLFIFGTITLFAQNEVDALRYSTQNLNGTARYSAMGGAFGALGGEFSALSLNPAGIGMYQFSEFTFTPSLNIHNAKSYYGDSHISDHKYSLNIANLGVVFTMPRDNSEWKRVNIAIGWNQLANYNNHIAIEGRNNTSSIVDNILDYAQGNTIDNLSEFHGSLAFWSDLIDLSDNSIDTITEWYANDNGNYISHVKSNTNKTQTEHIRSSGEENEFIFSIGGSYNEQLYIGATVGFPWINYYERAIYSEHSFEDTIYDLNSFDYEDELSVYGSGVNIKIGAIYRVNDKLKIGASLHSPTLYHIEETYSSSITTHFSTKSYPPETSPINYFEYELLTPWKATLSASAIFNKNILISGDYEIIDYSSSNMYSESYSFNNENETIANLYQKTENLRIGGEMNIKPFILRTGYSRYGSAFSNKDFSRNSFSYGIGIKNRGYSFDIAYILSQGSNEHLLYSEEYIDPIKIINTHHNLLFTLGFRY